MSMSTVRKHFCTEVARGHGRASSPRKNGLNGTMPAMVNRTVGSCGMRLADGTGVWPRSSKKPVKARRTVGVDGRCRAPCSAVTPSEPSCPARRQILRRRRRPSPATRSAAGATWPAATRRPASARAGSGGGGRVACGHRRSAAWTLPSRQVGPELALVAPHLLLRPEATAERTRLAGAPGQPPGRPDDLERQGVGLQPGGGVVDGPAHPPLGPQRRTRPHHHPRRQPEGPLGHDGHSLLSVARARRCAAAAGRRRRRPGRPTPSPPGWRTPGKRAATPSRRSGSPTPSTPVRRRPAPSPRTPGPRPGGPPPPTGSSGGRGRRRRDRRREISLRSPPVTTTSQTTAPREAMPAHTTTIAAPDMGGRA